jgi:hypothetical protein
MFAKFYHCFSTARIQGGLDNDSPFYVILYHPQDDKEKAHENSPQEISEQPQDRQVFVG